MPGDQPKKNYKRLLSITLSALCLINLFAPMMGPTIQPVNAQAQNAFNLNQCSATQSFESTMFAVTTNNQLLNFNPGAPGIINSTLNITGVGQGENIVGIDFRPANGQLFALSSASRLYIINPSSGAATPVGSAAISTALSGANFGFDFNPTVDRIRVVSNADQDLRLNPNNAAVAGVDGTLAYAATDPNAGVDPNIVGSAYTNNFAGSTVTTLYGIDSARDTLVTQGTAAGVTPVVGPNTGTLFTVGPLGVDAGDVVGFDIAPVTNAAFVAIAPPGGGVSTLYTLNLTTGAAVSLGPINARQTVTDIAFAVRAENAFAVTASNRLIKFNPGLPGAINNSIPISGIGGENIIGIDFRPATGALFALSDASRIYTINPTNGVATAVGGPFSPALNGTNFGFDFNPVPDRIRLVSDADQDLRLNPNNGALAAVDGTLAYATAATPMGTGVDDLNAGQDPNITGSAYTNSFLGTSSTTLYGIDSNLNVLVTQGSVGSAPVSPNSGQLFTVGPLVNADPNGVVGFDISGESGAAFASFNSDAGGPTQIFQINLTTGAATSLGAIGVSEIIRDIAVEARLPNVIALTQSNLLVHFNAATPGMINMIRVIRGLPRRERLVAIDFRPAAGYLYALSASNRVYLIVLSDPARALAVRLQNLNPALNGTNFGFDFNPVPDLIRLTSDAEQDLRVNPNTGAVAGTDGNLAYAAGDPNAGANPNIVGSAYTNSFLGAKATTLYGIDAGLGALVTQGTAVGVTPVVSPNTGQLFTVGSLGVPTGSSVGFDIASPTNAAFASFTPSGGNQSRFYTVNLNTGAATLIGDIPLRESVIGITIGGVARRGFDICLQDDRSGTTLQFDSCTGDYQFTKCGAGAFVQTGRGITSLQGNVLTLRANNVFAIVNANPGASLRSGTAVVRFGRIFTLNDRNTTDNTCGCR